MTSAAGSHLVAMACALAGLTSGAAEREGITITAAADALVLGRDSRVALHVTAPPGAEALRLFCTRGELRDVTALAGGRAEAVLLTPSERYPQLAIIVAKARLGTETLVGWKVLRLFGQGVARVHTRPRAPVSLRVGAQTFGPVLADAAGVASVPIVVPPGDREAFWGATRVPLGFPLVPGAFAVPEEGVVRADRATALRVYLFAVNSDGSPRADAVPALSADRGQLDAPAPLSPGVFAATWRFAAGPVGAAHLSGAVAGDDASAFELQVQVEAGPPARFELLAPSRLRAGAAAVPVEARAWDVAGNPALPLALEVSSPLGSVALAQAAPGRATGALTLGGGFGGREQLTLLLRHGGQQVAAAELQLEAGPASALTLPASPDALLADGQAEAQLAVRVEDRFGNPVRDEPPSVRVEAGRVSAVLSQGQGRYLVRVVPDAVDAPRTVRVTASAGEAQATAELALLPAWSRASATLRGGLLFNFTDVAAPGAGLDVDLWWTRLGLSASLDLAGFDRGATAAAPGFTGQNRSLALTAGPAWRPLRLGRLQGALGVSAGVAWVSARTAVAGAPPLEESAAVFAVVARARLSYRLGPGAPVVEARAAAFTDPGLLGLRGALVALGLFGGYRLELP